MSTDITAACRDGMHDACPSPCRCVCHGSTDMDIIESGRYENGNYKRDTPRPERVTLTSVEREALIHAACTARLHTGGDHDAKGACVIADDPPYEVVERILAARERALREEIAQRIESRRVHLHAQSLSDCEDGCGWFEYAARIARGETQ